MNIQAIKDELNEFIQTEFSEQDWDILSELAEIFVSQHGAFATSGDVNPEHHDEIRTTAHLNLDTLMELLQIRKDHRARTAKTIKEYLSEDVITYFPGTRSKHNKSQIIFTTFESFINACFCLRSPKAKLVSRFAAKCTSLVVELVLALQINLKKTTKELKKEKAEVFRRVYLVIKDAVAEARRELGFRYTDFKWRQQHYGIIISRLLGSVYMKGKTPYVYKENMQTAKQSIKKYYKESLRRGDNKHKDSMVQTTIDNVHIIPNNYTKTATSRCPVYIN